MLSEEAAIAEVAIPVDPSEGSCRNVETGGIGVQISQDWFWWTQEWWVRGCVKLWVGN